MASTHIFSSVLIFVCVSVCVFVSVSPQVMNLIGDVRGKVAVLVDDMIDTAGTITNSAKVLRAEGAREVYACASHAVFSPPAVERLSSGVFEEVIVTNTIPTAPVSGSAHLRARWALACVQRMWVCMWCA